MVKRLKMLAKIRHDINAQTLSMVYHGIFSSLLLYGSQIWGQSNQSVSKMENLQIKHWELSTLNQWRFWGGGGDRAMAQGPAQSMPPRAPHLNATNIFYTNLPTAVSKRSGKPPKSGLVFKNM